MTVKIVLLPNVIYIFNIIPIIFKGNSSLQNYIHTQRDRQTDRQTDRHTHTHTEREEAMHAHTQISTHAHT